MHVIGNKMVSRSHLLSVALLLLLACTTSYSSPLHDAAVNGNLEQLKQLLDSGKHDVNGRDANGRTPLAAALATCSECSSWSAALAKFDARFIAAAVMLVIDIFFQC
jgi:hypothetical protein